MRTGRLSLLLAAVAGAGCTATAEGAPSAWRRIVLVELFTSQGCSSCPPADTFVRQLPALGFGRDKVVPLTFHVDYWDRLGWKDPFANPQFTKRQAWYARSATLRSPDGPSGLDGIYTPQMIVDGLVQLSGQRRDDAVREMGRAAARAAPFDLTADGAVHGSTIELTVRVAARGDPRRELDWRLVVALAATKARTAVLQGENAGETLEEAAVVRTLSERIPLPPGPQATVTVKLNKPADQAWSQIDLVAFVQSEVTREIGGTSMLDRTGSDHFSSGAAALRRR